MLFSFISCSSRLAASGAGGMQSLQDPIVDNEVSLFIFAWVATELRSGQYRPASYLMQIQYIHK